MTAGADFSSGLVLWRGGKLYPAAISIAGGSVPDIFDEVNEELRADQARSLLRRYGALMVAAMVATLVVVGVTTWWQERQQAAADAVAMKFIADQKAAAVRTPPKDLAQRFADMAATGPRGYRVLATLQLATLDWDAGRHAKAIAGWHDVAADTSLPEVLRNLATITSVQHQVDTGDAAALKAQLLSIVDSSSAFRPLAIQTDALLDIRLGRTKEAEELMQSLVKDPSTPQTLRVMTQSLLTTMDERASSAAQ